MSDIVAMARAAQRDERLSDGALYGRLAAEIERLRERVAELEARYLAGGISHAGCACPPGANLACANAMCPRRTPMWTT